MNFSNNLTSQTNRPFSDTSELAGFSKHTVPPAQMAKTIRRIVLSIDPVMGIALDANLGSTKKNHQDYEGTLI